MEVGTIGSCRLLYPPGVGAGLLGDKPLPLVAFLYLLSVLAFGSRTLLGLAADAGRHRLLTGVAALGRAFRGGRDGITRRAAP